MTELHTIVSSRYIALLAAIDVGTVEELAAGHSAILAARMHYENQALGLVPLVPSEWRVSTWVHRARNLCAVNTH